MNKVLLIGYGNVGKATARSLPLGNIDIHDPRIGMEVKDPSGYDYAIVCVDTLQSGPQDYNDLDSVIDYLSAYSGVVVIRSTVDPDKTVSLATLFGNKLIMFPEFMDHHDFKSQRDPASRIVLGGTAEEARRFLDLLGDIGYPWIRETFLVSHQEASIIKLSSNAALATKVILFNTIHKICQDYGVPYEEVRKAIGADPRIGIGHTLVPSPDDGQPGFGGHCLPKDIKAIAKIDSLGLFQFVDDVNKKLGRS